MKVVYRSPTKIRRQGWFFHWISSATVQAAVIFIQFTKSVGIACVIRILCSAAFIVLTIPIIGWLFFLTGVYKRLMQCILVYLYPDEQYEIVLNSSLRTAFDSRHNCGILTALLKVDGVPDIQEIRQRIENWIRLSPKRFANTKKLLVNTFGCYAWKPTKEDFKIENHVFLSSDKPNRVVNEDTLKNYVCEMNSYKLPDQRPAWQIVIVPFNQQTPSYGVVIRLHHVLADNVLPNQLSFPTNIKLPQEDSSLNTFRQSVVLAFYTLANVISCLVEVPSILVNELTIKNYHLKSRKASGKESLCWTDTFSSQTLNKMAAKCGTNTNELIISCITGSLRRYYSVMEGYIPDHMLSCINCNNNQVCGFSSFLLPLATLDSRRRLLELQRQTAVTQISTSASKVTAMFLRYVNRILPYPLAKMFLQRLMKKYSCVINDFNFLLNFREFWHDEVNMVHCWNSLVGEIGISFSLMNFGEKFAVCVKTDLASIQRPDILLSYFVREMKDLAFDLNIRDERHVI